MIHPPYALPCPRLKPLSLNLNYYSEKDLEHIFMSSSSWSLISQILWPFFELLAKTSEGVSSPTKELSLRDRLSVAYSVTLPSSAMSIFLRSFLTVSQDLKVNLCGLQQDKRSDGNGKNNDNVVGIARRFPCYSYTVGPYGKGPTSNYTTCTYSN